MSTSTLCQVCESAVADHVCAQCGTAVCDDHFDDGAGLCRTCARSAGEGGGPGADDVGPGGADGMR